MEIITKIKGFSIYILIFLFALVNLNHTHAQDSSQDIEKLCFEIFNKLKEAKGLNSNDLPSLSIVSRLPRDLNLTMAMANSETGEITLEKRTAQMSLDSLGSEGINGIAFLLAHEISHFVEKHKVRHEYILSGAAELAIDESIPDNSLDAIAKKYNQIASKYQIRANESEADLEAGFMCYLAGYHSKTAGADFLKSAYKKFNIPNPEDGNYPTLAERMEITKRAGNQLDTLIKVYNMANYLNFLEEFELSSICYEYISKIYKSKEILNNKGVLYLKQAIQLIDPEKVKYALPITLDFNFVGGKGVDDEERKLYEAKMDFLNLAISNFEESASMSNTYATPLLNISIAHYLVSVVKKEHPNMQGKYIFDDLALAESFALLGRQAGEKDSLNNKLILSNIYTQLAILNDANGANIFSSKRYFDKAKEFNPTNVFMQANFDFINGNGKEYAELNYQKNGHGTLCNEPVRVYNNLTLAEVETEKIVDDWSIGILLKSIKKGPYSTKTYYFQFAEKDGFKYYNLLGGTGDIAENDIKIFEPKSSYTSNILCDYNIGTEKIDLDKKNNVNHKVTVTNTGTLLDFKLFYL
jgi:hypothetical protein